MKESFKIRIFGLVVTALSLAGSVGFMSVLIGTGLLTALIIAILCVVLAVLTAGIFLLVKNGKFKVRCIIGTALAVILLALQAVAGYYIGSGAAALSHISKPSVDYADIGVYVSVDDSTKELSEAKDYVIGILGEQDRENSDLAIKELEAAFGKAPAIKEYDGLESLMDGLLVTKEVGAVLVNTGFLDMLSEIEGHEEDLSKIRELCLLHIEKDSVRVEQNELPAMKKTTFTMYISGIDTFGKISKRSRSDVNILATVNVETGQVLLISTPRDYYVPHPSSKGMPDKLTNAGVYGIDASMGALEMLYDTEIDYYFRVNFDGFKKIIDALGGVTVYSNYEFQVNQYKYVKGENFLNGEGALHFARARKPVPGGDRTRGKHQMEVIKGVINKMSSPSVLTGYSELLEGVKDSFETSLPYEDISRLVRNQLNQGTKWKISTYSVDGKGASLKPYSQSLKAYVMIPDEETVEKAKELINQVKKGETPNV